MPNTECALSYSASRGHCFQRAHSKPRSAAHPCGWTVLRKQLSGGGRRKHGIITSREKNYQNVVSSFTLLHYYLLVAELGEYKFDSEFVFCNLCLRSWFCTAALLSKAVSTCLALTLRPAPLLRQAVSRCVAGIELPKGCIGLEWSYIFKHVLCFLAK